MTISQFQELKYYFNGYKKRYSQYGDIVALEYAYQSIVWDYQKGKEEAFV